MRLSGSRQSIRYGLMLSLGMLSGEAHLFHDGVRLSNILECLPFFWVKFSMSSFGVLGTEVVLLSGEQEPYIRDVLVFGETVDIS